MNRIQKLYDRLLAKHGPQGWWPLLELHRRKSGVNPTKTGSINGYHPGDYSYPKTHAQRFEICTGAILTQNTAWPNVEKALINLKRHNILDAKKLLDADENLVEECIRPAGYYNQKTRKLRVFARFYLAQKEKIPTRNELLALWGIGPETADSILLYAYKQPAFVVDTYTKRIFSREKLIPASASYDAVKKLCERSLPQNAEMYQEFHALLVEEGKHQGVYVRKP